MSKTAAERKQGERERRKALGLVRVEAWIQPQFAARVRRYIERLAKKTTL